MLKGIIVSRKHEFKGKINGCKRYRTKEGLLKG